LSFLHGVETIEIPSKSKPITAVRSAVIGLVGTAPIHQVDAANQGLNLPIVLLNDRDDAKYCGVDTAGYSIPSALKAIRAQEQQGAGAIVIVVNLFDPATHKLDIAAEAKTFANNVLTLAHADLIANPVVKDTTDATTYTLGTDYTVDKLTGKITRVTTGTIANNATVHVSYSYGNPGAVTGTDVIGGTTVGGQRTGMQAFLNARSMFGYGPRILIAPGYSTAATVVTALATLAGKLRAIAYVDAPAGTSYSAAIQGRGITGTINFQVADQRIEPVFPYVKGTLADGSVGLVPYSPFLAGVRAVKDTTNGYWWSVSNSQIKGIVGTEIPLTFAINDPNCECNQLNAVGITTIASDFGTGFLTWGNRNSSYPTAADVSSFTSVRRTRDVVEDSIEYSMLQWADAPVNQALIDGVQEAVNSFLRVLKGRGALIDGACWFDPADNDVSLLQQGQVTWTYDLMPPVPAERLTFKHVVNTDYLKSLLGGS
jgi:hypothetical protein